MTGRLGRRANGVDEAALAMTPVDRLASILMGRTLIFAPPFDGDWPVACLSQTTRTALGALTGQRYDGTGVAFHKQAVWDRGGAPAQYVRGDEYDAYREALPARLRARAVRYWPGWWRDPADAVQDFFRPFPEMTRSEWMMEREWRIPRPELAEGAVGPRGVAFEPADIAFILLPQVAMLQRVIELVTYWGGDAGWIRAMPLAVFDPATRSYVGAEHLWP